MEVKKYRYNDMTERYRRMNRFYIIATVVLGGSFIVYMWLKMVMSSISAMTVYGNTVVMAAFTIANTVIYMRNRATKQLKIIATYEVGIEFLLVGVQSDAHFISFAIIAIFLLQIPYFDKKGHKNGSGNGGSVCHRDCGTDKKRHICHECQRLL